MARYFAKKNQTAEKRKRLPIPRPKSTSKSAFEEDLEESIEDSEKSSDGEAIDVKDALSAGSTERSTVEKSKTYGVFDNYESFF